MAILHNKVSLVMAEINQILEEKKNMVNEKATTFRETRDEWNKKSKTHSTARNELNAEVKELIVQVREQRDIREQMNELVREKTGYGNAAFTPSIFLTPRTGAAK